MKETFSKLIQMLAVALGTYLANRYGLSSSVITEAIAGTAGALGAVAFAGWGLIDEFRWERAEAAKKADDALAAKNAVIDTSVAAAGKDGAK
jgi:hypothetical protein